MSAAAPSSRPYWLRLLSRAIGLWVGTVFFILGVVLTVIGVRQALEEQAYRQRGTKVGATVIGKSIERANRVDNHRTRYILAYRFSTPAEPSIEGSTEVSWEDWERVDAGKTFPLTYVEGNPGSARPSNAGDWIPVAVFIIVGIAFTLIGGSLAYYDLRGIARLLRVAKEGVEAQGTILGIQATGTSINRVTQYRLRYRYQDRLGKTHEGESHLMPPEEAQAWNEGRTGKVRFDHQRPELSVWLGDK